MTGDRRQVRYLAREGDVEGLVAPDPGLRDGVAVLLPLVPPAQLRIPASESTTMAHSTRQACHTQLPKVSSSRHPKLDTRISVCLFVRLLVCDAQGPSLDS